MPTVLEGLAGPVELYTYSEAAKLLDVRPQTIWTYVHRGLLRPIRLARGAAYPEGTPFLLGDEIAWYDRRRRLGAEAVGPSPYVERYTELLAAGAAVAPLLADADAQGADLLARIRGTVPSSTPAADALDTAPPIPGVPGAVEGAMGWGGLLILLIVVLLALWMGRQPDATKVAQLRATPGAGHLPQALREAADLLDAA